MTPLGRPKKDKKQLSLVSAFKLTKRGREDESTPNLDLNVEPSSCANEVDGNAKKEYKRKFLSSWTVGPYSWAFATVDDDLKERVKCSICIEAKEKGPFATVGSVNIQRGALSDHNDSEPHKRAVKKLKMLASMPEKVMDKHIELMVDAEKNRIISVMQIFWNVVMNDKSIESFEKECHFHMYMKTPCMPMSIEYSSYTNSNAAKEFLKAMYEVYWEMLRVEICESPYFSIMVDESTDRQYEKHLIMYITYLREGGFGACTTRFVRLVRIKDGKAQSMFDGVMQLLDDMRLDKQKLIGFASDGASSMIGIHEGLVAKLRRVVPHLVGVHCIAHRENLAVKDACEQFVELSYVDKFANKVHEWIGNSTLRREELFELYDVFQLKHYQVKQMHGVRWLSRGLVMKRLVKIMPALLANWNAKYPNMYAKATLFQVQFLVHFLADLLEQVNNLNLAFQKEYVDITMIGRDVDVLTNVVRTMYLGAKFGEGSLCLQKFLRNAPNGEFKCMDQQGNVIHVHKLRYESLPNSSREGSLDGCIALGKEFVNALLSNLHERFFDNFLFNAAKLFSPRNYPSDIKDRGQFARDKLEKLCSKFAIGASMLVDEERCQGELYRFVAYLMDSYPTKGLFDTWMQCGKELEWRQMFPALFKLFQIVLVLPSNSVMCERGFSKQNIIKSQERASLSLDTLDKLMFLSLCMEKNPHNVDWDSIFEAWKSLKDRRCQHLGASQATLAI